MREIFDEIYKIADTTSKSIDLRSFYESLENLLKKLIPILQMPMLKIIRNLHLLLRIKKPPILYLHKT